MCLVVKSIKNSGDGYTLVELMLVVSICLVVTAALFQSARIGVREMNLYTAVQQAQSLANMLRVDYELSSYKNTIDSLNDFLGELYTRQWPLQANGVFRSTDGLYLEKGEFGVDGLGCVDIELELKPCWSTDEGLWVEVYQGNQGELALLQVVKPSMLHGQLQSLVGLGMDAKMFQNHYFSQTSTWSDVSLIEAESDIRARGNRR